MAEIKAGESAIGKIAWSPSISATVAYTQDLVLEWSGEFNGNGVGDIPDTTSSSEQSTESRASMAITFASALIGAAAYLLTF